MIGRHKLLERVSPKKTWEGAIAGFVFSIISFVGCSFLLIKGLPLIHAIIAGAIVGTIGQIGDLVESLLKRDAAVKDSSNLLPGHGGALDRFDSIIFVMPVIFIYLIIASFYI
jgi:phosphatidate cytidylyltransferase